VVADDGSLSFPAMTGEEASAFMGQLTDLDAIDQASTQPTMIKEIHNGVLADN